MPDDIELHRRRSRKGKAPSVHFTRIELTNWRNFKSARIDIPARLFLVGPNASGKSNLLDAFRFLGDLVALGGGFQEAVAKRGGVSKLRCLAARRQPEVGITVSAAGPSDDEPWLYALTFKQDSKSRPVIHHESVRRGGVPLFERPDSDDRDDPERLRQTFLEQTTRNKDFRDLAEFFRSTRYLHLVPQLVREPDRYQGRARDPFGSDFLETIARTPKKTREAWLGRIAAALKVAVPQLKALEFVRDAVRATPHLRGNYIHWRPQGAWHTEEQFSDGTLRLLGLLWAVLEGTGPLLLEEPELSLHPAVVRHLPEMFARMQSRSGRQVFVSTHSADLLRDGSLGLDEVVLLKPGSEGTTLERASDIAEVVALVDGGLDLPEAIEPRTRPARPDQLALLLE